VSTLAIRRRAAACPAAVAILFALGPAPAPAATRCAGASAAPSAAAAAARQRAVVCEINRVRRRHGLASVERDARLARAASRYAQAMVAGRFFSHTSPGGSTLHDRLRAAGYRGVAAGETLAWAEGRLAAPRAIVRSWMRSGPHRRVLLGRYRHVGVGVALGSPFGRAMSGSATYAADFGAAR